MSETILATEATIRLAIFLGVGGNGALGSGSPPAQTRNPAGDPLDQ